MDTNNFKTENLIEQLENIDLDEYFGINDVSKDKSIAILDAFIKTKSLIPYQLESYNNFVANIGKIIEDNSSFTIEIDAYVFTVSFSNPVFVPPKCKFSQEYRDDELLRPYEARMRNMTYESQLFVDIKVDNGRGNVMDYNNFPLARIPVMLKSCLCNLYGKTREQIFKMFEDPDDTGGYFIIGSKKGIASEKLFVTQERNCYNKPMFSRNAKSFPKLEWYNEIKSFNNGNIQKFIVGFKKDILYVYVPFISENNIIPFDVFMILLGCSDDVDIINHILLDEEDDEYSSYIEMLLLTFEQNNCVENFDQALDYINSKNKKKICIENKNERNVFINSIDMFLFPHLIDPCIEKDSLSLKDKFAKKRFYIGWLVKNLLENIVKVKREKLSAKTSTYDRDHLANKRAVTVEEVFNIAFTSVFRKVCKDMKSACQKKGYSAIINGCISPKDYIKTNLFSDHFRTCFGNGDWGTPNKVIYPGTSQVYERVNAQSGWANLRKCNNNIQGLAKIEAPRRIHNSQYGMLCVTGDTMVLLADGVTSCRIDELEGKSVMTVNPVTLKNEPSGIYNFFKMTPDYPLLEIKDDCGRIIKCTPDHPFLINKGDENIWVNAGDLKLGDSLITVNTILNLSGNNTVEFPVKKSSIEINRKPRAIIDIKSFQTRVLPESKCISYVYSIKKIDPEPVYDFTTISENHSFIANEIVTHQCPSDTPESKQCGLAKTLSITAYLTLTIDDSSLKELALSMDEIEHFQDVYSKYNKNFKDNTLLFKVISSMVKLVWNGNWFGLIKPENVETALNKLSRFKKIQPETSISTVSDKNNILVIEIWTDCGRWVRPLFKVDKSSGKLLITPEILKNVARGEMKWPHLISEGYVEIVDAQESESQNILIAMNEKDITRKHTHCEIHPAFMYGINGILIPFPNHNQSPRVCYQCVYYKELVEMADGTRKMIKDIAIGDKVVSLDTKTLEKITSTVTAKMIDTTSKKILKIRTRDGRVIRCTQDHLFLTYSWKTHETEWVEAQDLRPYCQKQNISVVLYFDKVSRLGYISSIKECDNVIIADITVNDDNHNFIAGDGFCVHNCSMGKHAFGGPCSNIMYKSPGQQIVLTQPQKPIVSTKFADFIGYNKHPAGVNPIVAIANRGDNQEDSIEICLDSLERGLFDTAYYKDFYTCVNKTRGEICEIPTSEFTSETIGKINLSILNTEKDDVYKSNTFLSDKKCHIATEKSHKVPYACVKVGAIVHKHEIIIGKLKRYAKTSPNKKQYENTSIVFSDYDCGRVAKVVYGYDGDGIYFINVKILESRFEEMGNKFSSRIGQKGTCGKITRAIDMPFNPNSHSSPNPDMIINPHAFPGRMTIGHLIECLMAKKVVAANTSKSILLETFNFYKIQEKKTGIEKVSWILKGKKFVCPKGWILLKHINIIELDRETLESFYAEYITPQADMEYGAPKGDATPFENITLEEINRVYNKNPCSPTLVEIIKEELLRLGHTPHGHERLYDGRTGEMMEALIFIGPTFYQKLKHVVEGKIHARGVGPKQPLNRQPQEGRRKHGGQKVGEMERDCCSAPISLSNGLAINIKDMEDFNRELFSWSKIENNIVISKQSDYLNKGMKACIELFLRDGRSVICTPGHKFLTKDNEWIEAQNLTDGESVLKVGPSGVVSDINEYKECNGWFLKMEYHRLETNTFEDFYQAMNFVRFLGYFCFDGFTSGRQGAIHLGHNIDVEAVKKDLAYFCDNLETKMTKNTYKIDFHGHFLESLRCIPGVIQGKKINQPFTLPEFILDDNCPLPIIREYLGGMFGADGHAPVLALHRGKRDLVTSVSFSKSRPGKYLDSLNKTMKDIAMLLAKFDISSNIRTPKEITNSKKNKLKGDDKVYEVLLHIPVSDLIKFKEKIGFRYCCHKSQRLEAAVSFMKLRETVIRQREWLVNRVDEIVEYKKKKIENPGKRIETKKALEQAIKELEMSEPIIHKYAIPDRKGISDCLGKGCKFSKFNSKLFPIAEEYMKEIGAYHWFVGEDGSTENSTYGVKRDSMALETMQLTVVGKINVGEREVFDIQVDDTHSFCANGIVAHNCLISHGAAFNVKEKFMETADKYTVYVCKYCGLLAKHIPSARYIGCDRCSVEGEEHITVLEIPYTTKLVFQELASTLIVPRIIT